VSFTVNKDGGPVVYNPHLDVGPLLVAELRKLKTERVFSYLSINEVISWTVIGPGPNPPHLLEDVQVLVAEAHAVGGDVVVLVHQQLQQQPHLVLHGLQR